MQKNVFECYTPITIVDTDEMLTPCTANAFNFASFKYIDLTPYGGTPYTPVASNQDIIDAFAAIGLTALIDECNIYITDDQVTLVDVEAQADPKVTLVHNDGKVICNGGVSFIYSQFDYIDLSFYGGGEVEVSNDGEIEAAFAALGITANVMLGCWIQLVDWGGNPVSDPVVYDHAKVCVVDNVNPDGGFSASNINSYDCVDLSFFGGSNCFRADTTNNIVTELQNLTDSPVTYSNGCFTIKFYKNEVQDLEVDHFDIVQLVDTDEGLEPICVGNAYQYGTKFDYVNLSAYGGPTSVRVTNNSDVITQFSLLGIPVTINNCDITIQDCCITGTNIEVSADPIVTLVDTNEGITVCSANIFQFANFDLVDFSAYGGTWLAVSTNQEIIDEFARLGITAEITDCNIKLVGYTGTPADLEVCAYTAITLVDTDEGIVVCNGGVFQYANFDKVDFSPYGGTVKAISNDTELINELQALTGFTVTVSNCIITIADCNIQAVDLEVSKDLLPICDITITDPVKNCNTPIFDICFGGWLDDGQGGKIQLDDGDQLTIIIKSPTNTLHANALVIIGQDPTTQAGVVTSNNWLPPSGCTGGTEFSCYLENKVLNKTELLNTNSCFQFDLKGFAEANNLYTLDSGGNIVYDPIVVSFAVIDLSTQELSTPCEGTVDIDITYLTHSFVAPIQPGTPITWNQDQNLAHSNQGARVYTQTDYPPATYPYPYTYDSVNAPFNLFDSRPVVMPPSDTFNTCFWDTNGSSCFGRLYEVGLWNTSIPTRTWVGFAKCLVLESPKTFFIGFGADNAGRLIIDNELIMELTPDSGDLGEDRAFKIWWIIEISLEAGCHLIRLEGNNYGIAGAFGAEIYDNTLSELRNATSENDLNIIFSTKDFIGQQTDPLTTNVPGGVFCPSCYELEFTGCCLPTCVRNPQETLCPGETRMCTSDCDTWIMNFSSPSAGRIDWDILTNPFAPFSTYEITWYTEYGGTGQVQRFQNGNPAVGGNGPTGSLTSLPPGVYSPIITEIDGTPVTYNCLGHVVVN